MTQAVSRRPYTTEARVQSQVSPYEVGSGQSGNGQNILQSFSVPVSTIPPMLHIRLYLHAALTGDTE
jgi:triacylglycerol esterase/lipase EstA (alpha/beta hydrolase family)